MRIDTIVRHFRRFAVHAVVAIVAFWLTIGFAPEAQALPSFARQTGQPCGTCHTDFPALTPYGRRFKLLGYTTGGGDYRTTPFASKTANDVRAEYNKLLGYAASVKAPPPAGDGEKEYVPPISMMAIVGFTHTQAPLPSPADPYNPNDNTVLSPFSAFFGGAITDNVGAFAQVTYNAPPAGGFGDPFGHTWTWDNTDVRFANTTKIGSLDVVYGLTANNNPTVQDLWNTTPAWSFPYAASTLANTPGTHTQIEGGFAAHVGGVGAYTFINDLLYLELTGYKTLSFSQQNAVGTDPFGAGGLLDGVAPYWRVALEPHSGRHSLMIGAFGMNFDVHPWVDTSFASWTSAVMPLADRFNDIGFDSQYQYQGDNYWVTLRGSYIREFQRLDASFASLASANPTNLVNSLHLQASVAYGGDNRVVLTGQYFDIWGTADANLYGVDTNGLAMTPNSNGWTAEIAYIPFGLSKSFGWPWFNARIGLQYTYYNKFDGTTVGAQDNNTMFLHAWFAM
ncbi:cytochrome C [Bradyrhizobium sp.]|uniref:cytochrome C n=1 Tax=Bradyrhizobium sp. TaxID=376 RepID=UPI003C4CFB92